MSKKHWNTVFPNIDFDTAFFTELIDHSHNLVVAKMTKKDKELLSNM